VVVAPIPLSYQEHVVERYRYARHEYQDDSGSRVKYNATTGRRAEQGDIDVLVRPNKSDANSGKTNDSRLAYIKIRQFFCVNTRRSERVEGKNGNQPDCLDLHHSHDFDHPTLSLSLEFIQVLYLC
jgi:hypothetical protein